MLSFKASLKEIQLSLGRGQLQYFTFELIPALRSCLICGDREFSVIRKANSSSQRGSLSDPHSLPAHQDDAWPCRPTTVLDYSPATGKGQMQTGPAIMLSCKHSAQPHSLLFGA